MAKESNYPVGARWRAEANHMIGEIWLEKRETLHTIFEVWRWECHYDDGSGLRFDWGTSKGMVREACAVAMSQGGDKIVFKRVQSKTPTANP